VIRRRAVRRAERESRLGSPAWRTSFERRLAARANLARLTRWRSVDAGPPRFIDGNHGFYVHDGRLQLAWTLAAIDQARKRIDFEVYIYEPDAVGTEIRDHLAQAAQRGVAVRLLVDAVGGANAGAAFFRPLLDAGGHVVEFNPVKPWRLRLNRFGLRQRWEPNHRDHRKLLVCDATVGWARRAAERGPEDEPPAADASGGESAIAITGGRNVADHYLGLPLGQGQWRDCGIVLFGPAAVRLGEMFCAMWNRADGDAPGDDRPVPALASPAVGELAVLPLGSQPGMMNLLQWSLSRLTSAVQEELRISCSYFIPSARFRRTLVSVARRLLPCKIVIPLHNDIPIIGAASRHFLGMLLRAGLQIYRYAAETLHEKTFVYDRSVTVVGSSNVDQRSFRINYELSVIVLGEAFAAPVVRWHEADLADSERYTLAEWRARSWWGRLNDWFWWLFRSQL
jgi:cardiolipin synthase